MTDKQYGELVKEMSPQSPMGKDCLLAFVIGGATVYRQLLSLCDRIYVTKVFAAPEADAFFPDLDADPNWEVACQSEVMVENGLRFQYVDYVPHQEEEDDFLPVISRPDAFAPVDGFSPFSGF